MGAGLFQKYQGNEGSVKIKALGSTIGKMGAWTLSRRKNVDDEYTGDGLWDLRAQMVYLNTALLADPDYDHLIVVTVNKATSKQYRLVQQPGFKTEAKPNSLLMEGMKITSWPE